MRSTPGAVLGRAPPPTASAAAPVRGNTTRIPAEPGIAKKLHFSGRGLASLDELENDISSVIEQQKASMEEGDELILIIDQPDLLLAATGPSMGIGATEMADWITGLQQVRLCLVDRQLISTIKLTSSTARTCYDFDIGYGCPVDT
jgi:elongator complex protein 6